MEFVDTHCHLHFKNFGEGQERAYQDSLTAGVTRMICVGTTIADSRKAIEYATAKQGIWAAVGVHPHDAESLKKSDIQTLAKLLEEEKVIAAGEIGLDYYKNYSSKEAQRTALRMQIETALPSGLPYIFHVRDAWSDFWEIFDEYKDLCGVIHSFSSGVKQLDAALSRGLYVGLNGIMTFTKDHAQLDAAKQVPLDRMLLETDAPFLTPAPERDEICIPKHVITVAEFLAGLRHQPVEEVAKSTTDNSIKLFGLQ